MALIHVACGNDVKYCAWYVWLQTYFLGAVAGALCP